MKDIVRIEIDAPLETVSRLFADPEKSTQWMDDVEYEPVSGAPGTPGSKYRLLSKTGGMNFTATVLARDLPNESRLVLEAPAVTVSVRGKLAAISSDRTELVSEELFDFQGFFNRAFGFFARPVIRKAHRRHMESFKRFAETATQRKKP